ncbi:MAG: hypothetical protein RJA67_51, partial [Bacteroidota bacterium]
MYNFSQKAFGLLIFVFTLFAFNANAQVTTASLAGK